MQTVVPLTSNTARIFPLQALVPGDRARLRADSKAQAEQARSVDVERIGAAVGRVPGPLMASIDDALRLHLDP